MGDSHSTFIQPNPYGPNAGNTQLTTCGKVSELIDDQWLKVVPTQCSFEIEKYGLFSKYATIDIITLKEFLSSEDYANAMVAVTRPRGGGFVVFTRMTNMSQNSSSVTQCPYYSTSIEGGRTINYGVELPDQCNSPSSPPTNTTTGSCSACANTANNGGGSPQQPTRPTNTTIGSCSACANTTTSTANNNKRRPPTRPTNTTISSCSRGCATRR